MMKEQIRVCDWMMKFGQETHNNNPTIPSLEIRKLRARLILEEALETIAGLGFMPVLDTGVDYNSDICMRRIDFALRTNADLVEIADGIADSLVVNLGTAVACGIDIEPVFEEVMRSNDSKLWTQLELNNAIDSGRNDLVYKEHWNTNNEGRYVVMDRQGKVIKSPSYSPANISL